MNGQAKIDLYPYLQCMKNIKDNFKTEEVLDGEMMMPDAASASQRI